MTASAENKLPCPKCGQKNSKTIYKQIDLLYGAPGEFFVCRCNGCGLWFQNHLGQESFSAAYPEGYLPHKKQPVSSGWIFDKPALACLRKHFGYEHLKVNTGKNTRFKSSSFFLKRRLANSLIPRYVKNGKILEIGCARGEHLLLLKSLGWDGLFGIELSPQAAEAARESGFSIKCAMVETALSDYPDENFDTVICGMVLEHLKDPFSAIKLITKKLKNNGQLIFSTAQRNSLDAIIYGAYWSGLDLPRHRVFFTKKEIGQMLKDKFKNIKFYFQNSPIDFIRSANWRIGRGAGTTLDKLIINCRSNILSYFIFLFSLLGLTSRITVYAQKK